MSDWLSHDEDDHDDEDGIEWADPRIRENYEAALGRLILAHNEVDMHLTILLKCCLNRLGRPPALQRLLNGSFAQRLENILMLRAFPVDLQLGDFDYDALKELNRHRNVVAHGHFEQNPFDGDYVLLSEKALHREYSVDRLNEITHALIAQINYLLPLTAFYEPVGARTYEDD